MSKFARSRDPPKASKERGTVGENRLPFQGTFKTRRRVVASPLPLPLPRPLSPLPPWSRTRVSQALLPLSNMAASRQMAMWLQKTKKSKRKNRCYTFSFSFRNRAIEDTDIHVNCSFTWCLSIYCQRKATKHQPEAGEVLPAKYGGNQWRMRRCQASSAPEE